MKKALYAILILSTVVGEDLHAQYWGERVLEKGFENTEFFFTPSYLMPYGIGSFRSTTPGVVRDPLMDVIVNPAHLSLDTLRDMYLYTDFRSARTVKEDDNTFYAPWISMAERATTDMLYYPRMYLRTRRELEPVFSGAFIGRPLTAAGHDLFVGLTYQLVLQDDKYYSVPQDIYRSVLGYDYSGSRAAAGESIPVVDKYSGSDHIHQVGHFLSAFARYTLPMDIDLGLKVSRVMFARDGSFGSSNLWQYSPQSSGTSFWSNMEMRDQGYSHWDVAGGMEYHLNPQITIGASAGHLWGDATQSLHRGDSSYYAYSSNPSTSFYNRSGNTNQDWRHNGKTSYYGIDIAARTSPRNTLTLLYRHQSSSVEIGVGSAILDTSYSTYSWSDNTQLVRSYSQSYLSDTREGNGSRAGTADRLLAAVDYNIDDRVNVSVGAQLEWEKSETLTREAVLSASRSAYWSTSGNWESRYSQDESKDLLWTFTTTRTSFQVPVFVTIRASDVVRILLGLNRNMSTWRIDDVTLALFRYRSAWRNGTEERGENFGERYTAPTEEVSDVRTTFLAGLTISPSRNLQLRILMVPNFRDTFDGSELEQLQWWLGLTVMP